MKNNYTLLILVFFTQLKADNSSIVPMWDLPDDVHSITLKTYNDNRHRLIIHNSKGEIIKVNDSWKKQVQLSNALLQELAKHSLKTNQSDSCINVINDNNHVITHYTMQPHEQVHPNISTTTQTSLTNMLPSFISWPLAKFLIAGAGSLWFAYVIQLYYGAYCVSITTFWDNWKSELTIKELQAWDEKKLASDLFFAMRNKHTTKDSGHFLPLVYSIQEIDAQLQQLSYFTQLHEKISTSRLASIFPLLKSYRDTAELKMQRLTYLKHIATKFSMEYA